LSSSMQERLSRRSDFKPQRMMGVEGQKWVTSGAHCAKMNMLILAIQWRWVVWFGLFLTLSRTFSSELGQSIAKQTNRRSVSGYDSGRRRSYSSCPAVSQSASSTPFPEGLCSTCVM
jgi:hypothetical protein